MKSPRRLLFVTRDCLLRPTSGSSIYALDILRYLHSRGIRVEILLLIPSRLSYGCLIPCYIPDTGLRLRAPGFIKIGRWNVHLAAMLLLPARLVLSRIAIGFPKTTAARICSHFLQWLRAKTFPTMPTDPLGHFQADPTEGETLYVGRLLKRASYDALLLNYICLTPLLILQGRHHQLKRIVLAHDVWHQRAVKLKESGIAPDLKEWTKDDEALRYLNAEKVIGISWEERALLIAMLGEDKVMTVPKAVRQRNVGGGMVDGRCLFVGKDMPTNLDGLNWFLDDIWPHILQAHPNATFHICGSICEKITKAPERVKLCGVVDDLAREYEQATVVVIPIRTGSGVKIKLTEAVEFQRCCVSTHCGMEGLPAKDESGILVADHPGEFADHVCTLIGDVNTRLRCHDKTRAWASLHLNEDACYGHLFEFLQS